MLTIANLNLVKIISRTSEYMHRLAKEAFAIQPLAVTPEGIAMRLPENDPKRSGLLFNSPSGSCSEGPPGYSSPGPVWPHGEWPHNYREKEKSISANYDPPRCPKCKIPLRYTREIRLAKKCPECDYEEEVRVIPHVHEDTGGCFMVGVKLLLMATLLIAAIWLYNSDILSGSGTEKPKPPQTFEVLSDAQLKAEQELEIRAGETGSALVLTSTVPDVKRVVTIIAPGYGSHKYTFVFLDVRDFSEGGVLEINMRISPNSATDGTFDLFPATTTGHVASRGTLAGRHDVGKGASTRIEYPFQAGRVFALGLEGNWFSPKGATGLVQLMVTVHK